MLKKSKSKNLYLEDDDVVVIDKKTKRRMERQRAKEEQRQQAIQAEARVEPSSADTTDVDVPEDVMSQIPRLCQEQNWREAVLVCRRAIEDHKAEGREDMLMPLSFALVKLEMSLRRQMAAAFVAGARDLLKKEYLLDVGEE